MAMLMTLVGDFLSKQLRKAHACAHAFLTDREWQVPWDSKTTL